MIKNFFRFISNASNTCICLLPVFILYAAISAEAQLSLSSITFPDQIEEGSFQFYSIVKEGEDHSEYYSCTWEMGDGSKKVMLNQFELGHNFRDEGNYVIKFKSKDSKDREVSISQEIKVVNLPPVVRLLEGRVENSSNRRAAFNAIAYDPGNDELTYTWDFGDGNTKEGILSNSVMHTYGEPGVYKVRVTVGDGDGGSDYEEMTISVETDWHATISGDYNFELSGGAGLMYQTRIDTTTKEVERCFKMFTFYDDNNNSFLNVGTNTLRRLAGDTHSVGTDHKKNFMVIMHHDMKPSMYANMSSRFRMQEVQEDYNSLVTKSFQSLPLLSDMREAINTGENLYGIQFKEISGTLRLEPIKGNRLEGKMSALLEGSITGAEGEVIKKQIHINLEFNVRVNDVAKYNMKNGCEEVPDPFFISRYSPRNEKVNVNPDKPCIEIEFSEAVDRLSITAGNVKLGYYNSSDQFIIENVGIDHPEGNIIQLIPVRKLGPGIIYEVIIKGGIDGIRSLTGGELFKEENWSFSTQIVPSFFQARVYQTLADEPLIEGKNTMVRMELEWDRPKDVHEKSLVNEFPATVTLKAETGKVLGQQTEFIIKHQDNFKKNDRRLMKNSLNIFSWKPKIADGKELSIEIKPDFQTCVTEKESIFKFKHNVDYFKEASVLEIDYYYLQIDSLRDYIPTSSMQLGAEIMERTARFSKQLLPFKNVKISNKKGYKISASFFKNLTRESSGYIHMTEVRWNNYLLPAALEEFYLDKGINSKADIVLLFVPIVLNNYNAAGLTHKDSIRGRPIIPWGKKFIYSDMAAGHLPRPSITHEIGHTMFLPHKPFVKNGIERNALADKPLILMENHESHIHTSGCRIFDNGIAYNKDCREGNGEMGYVNNFMLPELSRVRTKGSWIDPEQFNSIISHLKSQKKRLGINLSEKQNDYYWVSTNKIIQKYDEESKAIYVKGEIDTVSNSGSIQYVKSAKRGPEILESVGAYVLECLNGKGEIIGKGSFNPDFNLFPGFSKSTIPFYSFVEISSTSNAKRLIIRHKEKILAEYIISDNAPTMDLHSPSINDTIYDNVEISWKANDIDNDDLTYSIYYTDGDLNDWQVKGVTKNKRMILDLIDLTSGPSPAFKVIASDGYHETEVIVPVHIDFPFVINRISPKDSAAVVDDFRIDFSNTIIPSSDANQWFRFLSRDSIGIISKIPYEVEYAENYQSVTLIPHHTLDPTLEYRISYGIKPPPSITVEEEKGTSQTKKRKRPLKDFLAKQVDKLTADEENEKNRNFLKDILGLPTNELPSKKEEVQEDRSTALTDLLGLNDKTEKDIFKIQDVFGHELDGYYSTQFRIKK